MVVSRPSVTEETAPIAVSAAGVGATVARSLLISPRHLVEDGAVILKQPTIGTSPRGGRSQ